MADASQLGPHKHCKNSAHGIVFNAPEVTYICPPLKAELTAKRHKALW